MLSEWTSDALHDIILEPVFSGRNGVPGETPLGPG